MIAPLRLQAASQYLYETAGSVSVATKTTRPSVELYASSRPLRRRAVL